MGVDFGIVTLMVTDITTAIDNREAEIKIREHQEPVKIALHYRRD
jgi:hypothetical protein